jgi:hypothetical protein
MERALGQLARKPFVGMDPDKAYADAEKGL